MQFATIWDNFYYFFFLLFFFLLFSCFLTILLFFSPFLCYFSFFPMFCYWLLPFIFLKYDLLFFILVNYYAFYLCSSLILFSHLWLDALWLDSLFSHKISDMNISALPTLSEDQSSAEIWRQHQQPFIFSSWCWTWHVGVFTARDRDLCITLLIYSNTLLGGRCVLGFAVLNVVNAVFVYLGFAS